MSDLEAALAATWPAASVQALGPVTLRQAPGAGMRVQAATLDGAFDADAMIRAEGAMRAQGCAPLVRVRPGQEDLDAWLAARGYALRSPTRFLAAPVSLLARPPRPISLFAVWPPLAIQVQLWADGGQDPARRAVMDRALGAKAAFLARVDNRAAGVAFAALHNGTAMLHALWVPPDARRKGVGRLMTTGIAHWAAQQGAQTLALAVEQSNTPARALYETLGMQDAGEYHYREAPA